MKRESRARQDILVAADVLEIVSALPTFENVYRLVKHDLDLVVNLLLLSRRLRVLKVEENIIARPAAAARLEHLWERGVGGRVTTENEATKMSPMSLLKKC